MSNVGYAVFGSPRGLAVVSNGLFKALELDEYLYLNNAHVVLEKGERVLMVRRIPSNPNDLEKKDALLIALYENALQYGENRAGGFVGSAICFKYQMPNADEMISGLTYLFSKMKENVDGDNRFKSIDSSGWNVKLPDANKKFGLEDSKLMYSPITATNKNIVVKLNSLDKEATSLLYCFSLNRTFHSINYLYASSSKDVVNRIKLKGFTQLPFAEFFNYKKQLHNTKETINKESEKLETIKRSALDLQKKSELYKNELKSLESKFNAGKNSLSNLDKEITEAETRLNQLRNKARSTNAVSPQHSKTSSNNRELEQENKILKDAVEFASEEIKNIKNVDFDSNKHPNSITRRSERVKYYFSSYDKRKNKKERKLLSMFSILLMLLLTFLGLFIWKSHNFNKYIKETKQSEQVVNNRNAEIEAENKKTDERLKKLNSFEKGSATFKPKKYYDIAEVLLTEHLADKTNEKEKSYINERKWEFYEFDYTNEVLVEKLDPSSKETYFILLKNKTIKPFNPYFEWKGLGQMDQLLSKYKNESNDIYQDIHENVLTDDELLLKHFKWLIEKENGKVDEITNGKKIKLPFTSDK